MATSTPNPTWYDILGVARDASPDAIKAAWRAATDKFEPGSGTSQFRLFNEAADVLLDPDRRAAYDAELAAGAEEPEVEAAPAAEPVETPDAAPSAEPSPAPEPAAEVEPAPEVGPVETPEPETGSAAAPTGLLALFGRLGPFTLAAMAVVLVAALVLAGFLAVRIHDRVTVSDSGPDASAAAERALTAVLSYDYRHMDADRDRSVQFLTPAYKKQYLKTFALLTQGPDGAPGGAVKTKAVVTADVLDTGVVDAESGRVRVIAFVNQSSVKGTAQPAIFQNRVVVTMVHRGDRWLVDNIKSY